MTGHTRSRFPLGIAVLLLIVSAGGAFLFYQVKCIDGCGPYQNRSSVADLDDDGDLDVILWNRRHESEYIVWQGATIWTNLGGGKFTAKGLELPELEPVAYFAGVAGDVDGDGSADITLLAFNDLRFYLNHGGEPGWAAGIFRLRDSAKPGGDPGTSDWIVFGDLDNDGDLDAVVADKNQALIWLNDGKAGFTDSGQRLHYNEQNGLAVADFNGDGYPDVFSAAYSSQVHLWRNLGNGMLR